MNTPKVKLFEHKIHKDGYSTAGRYDLAVIVRGKDNESPEELITNNLLRVQNNIKSKILANFRVYSRYNLERPVDPASNVII